MEPVSFLDLAEKLILDPSADESFFRTSIGRSYYFSFHYMLKKIEEAKGYSVQVEYQPHSILLKILRTGKKSQFKAISNHLTALRDKRVDADYFLKETIDKNNAQACLKLAKYIKSSADSLVEADYLALE